MEKVLLSSDWAIVVKMVKRLAAANIDSLSQEEQDIVKIMDSKFPPACSPDCIDFNTRGLPLDFDTRLIAYLTTNPMFDQDDRSLILKAVMSYAPSKDEKLVKLSLHVIREFRKALASTPGDMETEVKKLSMRVEKLIGEIEFKDIYSQKLLDEITSLITTIQGILKKSSGSIAESETEVINAFDSDMPKEKIIDLIKSQNKKIIGYFKEESKKASKDAMTGLMNRASFDNFYKTIVDKSKKEKAPLSIIMLDIDHFKRVNDTYGHVVGDEAIKFAANGVSGAVKNAPAALCARYGGEEFVVILRGYDVKRAVSIAELMRMSIAEKPFSFSTDGQTGEHPITISLGVAQLDGEDDLKSLLTRADKALYEAKTGGRNRVCSL